MGEIINTNTAIETQPGGDTGALLDITQSLLADARTALNSSGVLLLLTKWKGSQRCVSVSIKSCCSNDMKRSLCTHIASCNMERSGS